RGFRHELGLGRREIDRRAWDAALPRLEALARSWAARGGEVDYWLGLCHWNSGRRAAAVAAFRRVPAGSDFEVRARAFEAEDLLLSFRFRAAQDALRAILPPRDPGCAPVGELLV